VPVNVQQGQWIRPKEACCQKQKVTESDSQNACDKANQYRNDEQKN
jgi:hypothetical protein